MPADPHTAAQVTEANQRYHDALAASYDDRQELFHPEIARLYHDLFARRVYPRLPSGRPLGALDVGCGTGFLAPFLVGRFHHVVGVDVSEGMLARARTKYPQVDYRVGDVYRLAEVAPGPFDLVCANALLHHLKDWEPVLASMVGLLRPGGVLFLGYEPNAFAFRALGGVRRLYRRVAPEARVSEAADPELEAMAEYHQFYGDGLSPRGVARSLAGLGMTRVRVHFRAEHVLGQLEDRLGLRLLGRVPTPLTRLAGPLAPNFHLTAVNGP